MYQELLEQILTTVLIPLLVALAGFAVKWINAKANEIKVTTNNELLNKYIDMLTDTVTNCVVATNQTYVESLKKNGAFTEEAQKEAFNQTYEAVMKILSEDAKEYLTAATGDLNTLITQMIEANVNESK